MKDKISKQNMTIFPIHQPRKELLGAVLVRVHLEEKRRAIKRVAGLFIVFAGSTVSLFTVFGQLFNSISSSGFLHYISLGFSDGSVLMSHVADYAFSLMESFPTIEVIVFLAVGFICLGSIKSIINNYQTLRYFIKKTA